MHSQADKFFPTHKQGCLACFLRTKIDLLVCLFKSATMRLTLCLFSLSFQTLYAQLLPFSSFGIKSDYYAVAKARIDRDHFYTVESPKPFSGVILKVADTSFANSYVVLAKDTVFYGMTAITIGKDLNPVSLLHALPVPKAFPFTRTVPQDSLKSTFSPLFREES